jgi:hypothetical protein
MDSQSRIMKRTESSAPIFNMEDIEEGIEGACLLLCISFILRDLRIIIAYIAYQTCFPWSDFEP